MILYCMIPNTAHTVLLSTPNCDTTGMRIMHHILLQCQYRILVVVGYDQRFWSKSHPIHPIPLIPVYIIQLCYSELFWRKLGDSKEVYKNIYHHHVKVIKPFVENTRHLMITHTIESYWIPSRKKTKSELQISRICQNLIVLILKLTLHATHL